MLSSPSCFRAEVRRASRAQQQCTWGRCCSTAPIHNKTQKNNPSGLKNLTACSSSGTGRQPQPGVEGLLQQQEPVLNRQKGSISSQGSFAHLDPAPMHKDRLTELRWGGKRLPQRPSQLEDLPLPGTQYGRASGHPALLSKLGI